jgi:hypothetical protein
MITAHKINSGFLILAIAVIIGSGIGFSPHAYTQLYNPAEITSVEEDISKFTFETLDRSLILFVINSTRIENLFYTGSHMILPISFYYISQMIGLHSTPRIPPVLS